MGNLLEVPATAKETTREELEEKNAFKIEAGISGMQGYRKEMEDQHIHIKMPSAPDHLFLGVFDGHGGKGCAIYVCGTDPNRKQEDKCLYEILEETEEWKGYLASGNADGTGRNIQLLKDALVASFKAIDTQMQAYVKENPYKAYTFGGCTAVTVMITPEYIVCANAGDSRATMSKIGGSALTLSEDHKPTNPAEDERIRNAGGYVSNGRVDGNLAVSRGLGDFEFKLDKEKPQENQKVSCIPEFYQYPRDFDNEEMIILACDGLWDVFSNDDAINRVRDIWSEGENNIEKVAEEMIDLAMFKGSEDNISAIVVKLKGAVVASGGGGVDARREKRPDRGAKGRDYDLHSCAKFGDLDKIRLCIERENYDANEQQDRTGKTALFLASENDKFEIVEELLGKYSADRNIEDNSGMLPIHAAASKGHLAIVRKFIEQNEVDVNVPDKSADRKTPLAYAKQNSQNDVAEYLVSNGGLETAPYSSNP